MCSKLTRGQSLVNPVRVFYPPIDREHGTPSELWKYSARSSLGQDLGFSSQIGQGKDLDR